MESLLNAEAVAERIGVTHWTVREWARAGKIPAHRISRRVVRFLWSEVATALGLSGTTDGKKKSKVPDRG